MSDHVNPESLPVSETSSSSAADSAPEAAPGAAAQLASAIEHSSAAEKEIAPPTASATIEDSAGGAASGHEGAPDPSSENSAGEPDDQPVESFAEVLQAFERSHTHRAAQQQLEGTVVSVSADRVFSTSAIRWKVCCRARLSPINAEGVKPGDDFPSPSPDATKRTTTSFRAFAWRNPVTGRVGESLCGESSP